MEIPVSKPAIGKLIHPLNIPPRDAIHVPIIPVRAAEYLTAGDKVSLAVDGTGGTLHLASRDAANYIGVVDPYIGPMISPGEIFYCFLRPNSVKKLWHEWTHPTID